MWQCLEVLRHHTQQKNTLQLTMHRCLAKARSFWGWLLACTAEMSRQLDTWFRHRWADGLGKCNSPEMSRTAAQNRPEIELCKSNECLHSSCLFCSCQIYPATWCKFSKSSRISSHLTAATQASLWCWHQNGRHWNSLQTVYWWCMLGKITNPDMVL